MCAKAAQRRADLRHGFNPARHAERSHQTKPSVWWHAKTALDALPIEWDNGDHTKQSSAEFAKVMRVGLDANDAAMGNQNGDVKAALGSAAKKIEAIYAYPHQNHACMETMNATAR